MPYILRPRRFDPGYLAHFPFAVVRADGRLVAFCNIWPGDNEEELSVDLMRHRPDAFDGVMEYLFIRLIHWGQEAGFRWFNLGMVPLAGLPDGALAPLWSRLGTMVFRHGEHFYNFQGLRQFKGKFDSTWTPRYLVAPRGLVLPVVLTNLAALISGGLRGLVAKYGVDSLNRFWSAFCPTRPSATPALHGHHPLREGGWAGVVVPVARSLPGGDRILVKPSPTWSPRPCWKTASLEWRNSN